MELEYIDLETTGIASTGKWEQRKEIKWNVKTCRKNHRNCNLNIRELMCDAWR